MNINVEPYLTPGTLLDLRRALNFKMGNRSLRLVRIPVEEFGKVMDKILVKHPFFPFRPVIFDNIPIDMTESMVPECVMVADDDTNLIKQDKIEIEIGVN